MSAGRDVTPVVRSWLEQRGRGLADPYQGFDRFLELADATLQVRRRWWVSERPRPAPTRSQPTSGRSHSMFSATRLMAVAVIVALGTGSLYLAAGQGPSRIPAACASPSLSPRAQSPSPPDARAEGLPPTGPAGNGLIAFASGGDIWVVNPDGSDRRQLTTGPALDDVPAWSRDGTRLAYWSQDVAGAPTNLIVVDADGSAAVTLACDEAGRTSLPLDWSPDGSHVAYSLCDDDPACDERIFVAASDGSGSKAVGDPALRAWWPRWSPDGTLLAFGGSRAGVERGVYLMAPDGSGVRRLSQVQDDADDAFFKVDWSPDGTRIATQASRTPGGPFDIWVIALDGSGEINLTDGGHGGGWPTWSPDGLWLAGLGGGRDLSSGVQIHSSDGSGGSGLGTGDYVVWSPDATAVGVGGPGPSSGLSVTSRPSGEVRAYIAIPDQVSDRLNYPSWQRVAP